MLKKIFIELLRTFLSICPKMSAGNENGVRLDKFKNKGKDANVSDMYAWHIFHFKCVHGLLAK